MIVNTTEMCIQAVKHKYTFTYKNKITQRELLFVFVLFVMKWAISDLCGGELRKVLSRDVSFQT